MNKMLKKPAVAFVGVATLAVVAGVFLWNMLDLGPKWAISSRVDDLAHGLNIERARRELTKTPRGPTIEALKGALDDDGGTPWGKIQVLQLLGQFKESRAVMRALDSNVQTTRRGATYLRQGDKRVTTRVSDIAMEWLKDEDAADRHLAVMILRTTDRRDAIPDLLAILKSEAAKRDSARLTVRVLDALGYFKPDGIAPQVLALASDATLEPAVRNEAMKVLTYLEDTPREDLLKLLIAIAQDGSANTVLRTNSVSLLGRPQNATPEAWEVLKSIVLDPDNSEQSIQILQRGALRALVTTYPLDKLGKLMLDRRVYAHPYFGVRTDAACGIGNLGLKSRLALQILTEMLAENDADDFLTNVPRQAWISFWLLTGVNTGSSRPELFRRAPPRITDDDVLRRYLLSISHAHPSVNRAQANALDVFTLTLKNGELRRDDVGAYRQIKAEKFEKRKAIAQILRDQIDDIVVRWEKSAKKKDESEKKDEKSDEKKGD